MHAPHPISSPCYGPAVPGKIQWTLKRRLFVISQLAMIVCLIGGLVFMFIGRGFSHILEAAVFIAAVVVANLVLRLTYFRTVLPEIREERERFRV